MCSLNYYKGFSVVRTMSLAETHEIIQSYANKLAASPAPYGHYHKPHETTAEEYCSALKVKQVKCDNITPQNIGGDHAVQHSRCEQQDGIGHHEKYTTLRALIESLKESGSGECLADIRLDTQRKLSKQCIQNIYNF